MGTFRISGENHTYIGLLSLIFGVVSLIFYALASWTWVFGIDILFETEIMIGLILGGIGFVSGLVARFGSKKDDWGTVGIAIAIIVQILHLL